MANSTIASIESEQVWSARRAKTFLRKQPNTAKYRVYLLLAFSQVYPGITRVRTRFEPLLSRHGARSPTLAGLVPICPRGHFSQFEPKVPHFSHYYPRVAGSESVALSASESQQPLHDWRDRGRLSACREIAYNKGFPQWNTLVLDLR